MKNFFLVAIVTYAIWAASKHSLAPWRPAHRLAGPSLIALPAPKKVKWYSEHLYGPSTPEGQELELDS